jgi:hypothetical protein
MNRSLNNSLKSFALSFLLVLLPACSSDNVTPLDGGDAHGPDVGNADTGAGGGAGQANAAGGGAGHADAAGGSAGHADAAASDTASSDVAAHDAVASVDVAHDAVVSVDVVASDTGAVDAGGHDAAADVNSACAQAPVALGGAAAFAVLAGSTVTNTGLTTVTGDLGLSPGTAVTGFGAGTGTLVGTQHAGDPTAAQAEADLTTAYNDAAGRTLCPVSVAGNLGGQTLTPGLYKSISSLEISSGDLTLDARGDANAVFIFQMASTLTTSSGRQVVLTGGARSTNVFWQVGSSAVFGSTTSFQGTVMADQAITFSTGATLNGRALARIAAVTLDTNTIVKSTP